MGAFPNGYRRRNTRRAMCTAARRNDCDRGDAFIKPVYVGDVLCVYAAAERVGRTSIAVRLEAWALRKRLGDRVKVTEGIFTFVALDGEGRPTPIAGDLSKAARLNNRKHRNRKQERC